MEGATIETKSKVFVNRLKNEGNDWIFNNIEIYAISIRYGKPKRNNRFDYKKLDLA